MSVDDAWNLEISELDKIVERRNKAEEITDHRIARICLTIAKSAGNKKAKYEDFLPQVKAKGKTAEQMAAEARIFAAAFGGE